MRFAIPVCLMPLALAACGSAPDPEPLRPPDVESEALHFTGTLLTGPVPDSIGAEALTPSTAYDVRCRLVYVENLPDTQLAPVESRSLLVVDTRDADPLVSYTPFGSDARVGSGEEAQRFLEELLEDGARRSIELESLRGISSIGITAAFAIRSLDTRADPLEGPVRPALTTLVSRDPSAEQKVQVALLVQNFRDDSDTTPGLPGKPVSRRIVLLEDRPIVGGPPLVLAIPSRFAGEEGNGFVLSVKVDPPSDTSEHTRLVDEVASRLNETTEEAIRRATAIRLANPDLRAMQRGFGALALARNQRPAMIFLAASADGGLALDVALSGDDVLLTDWIEALREALDGAAADPDSGETTDLGWQIERSAWLATLGRASSAQLDPAIRGLLLRHAGEAARYPDLLIDTVKSAGSGAALTERLVQHNLEFLTDNDTAARTRAHDWLVGRGRAIEGYDPLASREERRAALEAAEQASSEDGATTNGASGS